MFVLGSLSQITTSLDLPLPEEERSMVALTLFPQLEQRLSNLFELFDLIFQV